MRIALGEYRQYKGSWHRFVFRIDRKLKHKLVLGFEVVRRDLGDATLTDTTTGIEGSYRFINYGIGIDILIWRIGFYYNCKPKLEAQP